MWTVIHIVQSEDRANEINEKLFQDGFLVKIQPINKNDEDGFFQILVPEGEAEEASNLIDALGLS